MRTPTMHSTYRRLGALTLATAVAACATAKPPASLTQAEQIYSTLATSGGDQRVEAEMIKARNAIADAQNAMQRRQNQEFVSGLSHIALRAAQTAEAENARVIASAQADSLQQARLNALLSLSEAQRQSLMQQQQLSAAEIQALSQETDSLRRANEAANAALQAAFTQLRTLVTEITNLKETSRGLVISLSDILFDVNRATLKPGAETNVRRIAAVLKQYPDKQISVEGHTDATGSDTYNQKLSEDRAASVRASLVAGGVDPNVITSKGLGESQPVATNDTPAGRQQNRRVEVIVLGAGTVADAAAARTGAPAAGAVAPGGPPSMVVPTDTTIIRRDTTMMRRDSITVRDSIRVRDSVTVRDSVRTPADTTGRPPR